MFHGNKVHTRHTRIGKENMWGWIFTGPFAIVFVLFLVIPLCYAFYMSLYTYTQVSGEHFSGFANYARV